MTYYRTIFYPNLTKKKAKKTLSSKFARFRKEEEEEKERGESERNAVNPGSSVYDRAYSWRYRLLGTPMQLHNEVVRAIAAINLAEARVCMRTSDVSGKMGYGNACKSCNKSIIYIWAGREESVTGRDRVGVKGKRDSRQGVLERSARYGAAD